MTQSATLTPAAIAARVAALADFVRSQRASRADERAERVDFVARLAQAWLEESAITVRAELAARVVEVERRGDVPSLFTIMGRPWLERPFNDVLAWICDPQADHGVGAAVLRGIAKLLGQPALVDDLERDAGAVRVLAEAWPAGFIGDGQPDLLVDSPSILVLIENKVRAGESGEDQYQKYHRSLKQLAVATQRPYAAFLLAPELRDVPMVEGESWEAAKTHAEIATAIRAVAHDAGTPAWGRVLCLLVASELSPTAGNAASLHRAKALLAMPGAIGRMRHVAEMRHLTAQLALAPSPWPENRP